VSKPFALLTDQEFGKLNPRQKRVYIGILLTEALERIEQSGDAVRVSHSALAEARKLVERLQVDSELGSQVP